MTQIELNKALDGVTDCSDSLSGEQVLGISTNSKEIIPGFIFVAIRGTNFDGNDFIDEALDRGAICAITDSKDIIDTNKIIKVKNCRKVVGKISANLYDHPQKKIKIIGIFYF